MLLVQFKGSYWLVPVILLLYLHPGRATWWELSHYENETGIQNSKLFCSLAPNLDNVQRKMCRKRSNLILTLGDSTRVAIKECQFQFQFFKWNCSVVKGATSIFGNEFIKGGTAELAYVQALTSANAVLAVSRACGTGEGHCGCTHNSMVQEENQLARKNFKMNGCQDSFNFALHFVRRFADGSEIERSDPKARMTIFNNKAGRMGILKESSKRCQCHGISGSCTFRSCWMFPPRLHSIATILKTKYDRAVKVDFNSLTQADLLTQKKLNPATLIYFEDSPDGCIPDVSRGLFGVGGRPCNATSPGVDSCDRICCGQGHETIRRAVTYKCDCIFEWCCHVKCRKICQVWKAYSHCKEVDPDEGHVANSS